MAEAKKRGRPPKPKEVEADNIQEAAKEIVKKKPSDYSPVVGDNGIMAQDGDNAKFLNQALEISQLPPLDLTDDEAVEKRVIDYFSICAKWDVKPAVSGLAMALGMDRRRLWEVKADVEERNLKLSPRARDAIKKGYNFLENLWENYMLNYKIHPTAGIFLGKNNFGYKDEQTYNLVPNNPMGAESDPAALAQKYQKAIPGAAIETEGAEEE